MSHSNPTADPKRLDKPAEQVTGAVRSADQTRELERQFKRDNADAFASMNAWVEEHGLPLEKYRPF